MYVFTVSLCLYVCAFPASISFYVCMCMCVSVKESVRLFICMCREVENVPADTKAKHKPCHECVDISRELITRRSFSQR